MPRASSAKVRIVPLEKQHIPAILEIEAKANGSPWSARSFENELDHAHGVFLVALDQARVVGYGGMWLMIDEAHVTTLAVDEEARRNGVGLRVMNALLEEAKQRGMLCCTLEVRASNEPALALYEKMGFVRAGVRKQYYPDNREDAVIMWLHDLKSWEPPQE